MGKRKAKKPLKAARKNPLLEKLKAKHKQPVCRSEMRHCTHFQALRNSK